MKFNPITKSLYTADNQLLKVLDCPYSVSWASCSPTQHSRAKVCSICDKEITDTSNLTDQDLLEMTKRDAGICLKIDLDQANLRVVTHDL
ncbi:MAG TPA: hypothetical protein EYN03_08990 [Planctomycetes bacterium]|nr:hypothetical protein [Planctomycetota bacterium]